MWLTLLLGLLGFLSLAFQAQAFYIPGWSIRSYAPGAPIPLLVNKVFSDRTQLQFAYRDLPFVCPPTGTRRAVGDGLFSGQNIPLNLGEVLRGDRITVSDMELHMQRDTPCTLLCRREVSARDLRRARDMVREGYAVEWIVDNLPGATSFVTADKTRKYYAAGFKLGYVEPGPWGDKGARYFLHTHHSIVIRYRKAPGKAGDRGEMVIVGFEVYPKSIAKDEKRDEKGCPEDLNLVTRKFELTDISEDDDRKYTIPYTYSVFFREENNIEWRNRWDLYFVNQEDTGRVHWMAIINSLFICALLAAVVLVIFARTVRADISQGPAKDGKPRKAKSTGLLEQPGEKGGLVEADEANADLSDDEDPLDITGWRLLHTDVFRPPRYGYLLAPLVGSGTQLLFMAIGLILLSAIGVLNPSFRGGFISFAVGLFVFAGLFSGYFSARVYKTFGGRDWHKNMTVTALLFPGLLFAAVFVLNLFVWARASSTAIPFTTLIGMLALWLGVQVPLVYLGARYGYLKAGAWDHPAKPASIPRQIPSQPWYLPRPGSLADIRTALLAGAIPFAVIFIELLFVFQSVWQDKSGYYYMFGFLAIATAILLITVAEVSVVVVYVMLCAGNYHWWWQSFLVGGGSAVWVFGCSVWYYWARLNIEGVVSSVLFFAYSAVACCVYGLLTGTVGFLGAYAFVRRIYG